MKKQPFSDLVVQWQLLYGRNNLPWQQNPSLYRVWISEIMLQQTQVTTVLKYFDQFIARFPNVESLAKSQLDEILVKWSGLGYYRRAKLIHKAAKTIVETLDGHIPSNIGELMKLPGIGRSTAGAIVSLSLDKKAVILDANVKKILIRYHGIQSPVNNAKTEKELWKIAEKSLPEKGFRSYNQGLMDLGATICFRSKPKCEICPLEKSCKAKLEGTEKIIPKKLKTTTLKNTNLHLAVFINQKNQILLKKQKNNELWSGLWHLPESHSRDELLKTSQKLFSNILVRQNLHPFSYQVSNKKFFVEVIIIKGQQCKLRHGKSDNIWFELTEIENLGTSSLVKKIASKTTNGLLD